MITIPKTPPPPILYKYCPPERVDILESLHVRFSPPTEFNDAFDTYHLIAKTEGIPGLKLRLGRALLRSRLGVLCLTERPDNHNMWVNYARNHTGFVIGFDANSPFFHEDRDLRKVIYQASPPIFDAPDENGCFYKSPAWEYEQEWRCIRRFEQSESRLVSLDWALIKQIIFGHQIAKWLVTRIVQQVVETDVENDSEMLPTFFFSRPLHSEWKFVNKPTSLAVCEHCSGDGYVEKSLEGEGAKEVGTDEKT